MELNQDFKEFIQLLNAHNVRLISPFSKRLAAFKTTANVVVARQYSAFSPTKKEN